MTTQDFLLTILLPAIGSGLLVTLSLVACSAPFGLLTGIGVALGRTYGSPFTASVCRLFVLLVKGCPLLILLFIIYFGLPSVGIRFSAFVASVLGFILCNGAYTSEYIRGALASIRDGQMTAALALGMTRRQAIRYVMLPQAMQRAVPGIANEMIYLIKYSSLAYMLTCIEVTGAGKIVAARYFTYTETFAVVGLVYLALVTIATWVANYLEERYRVPGMMNAGEPI